MFKRGIFVVASAAVFAVLCASQFASGGAPGNIRIVKTVRDNPTLYFGGYPANSEVGEALNSFLWACGWFDRAKDADSADYVLKASSNGSGGLRLDLSCGGASAGSWGMQLSGNVRRDAQKMVDTIIQSTFDELKIKGFCTTRIAFCAETKRGVKNIYACDIDGNEVEQLTNFNSLCVEPCWFPDGRSIGYSKYRSSGIDVLQTTLSPKRSRVLSSFRGINAGAAVSPDGKYMAVILSPDHKVDLYVVPIAGGKPRRLTNSVAVEASPCWSPDGGRIAFVSDEGGSPRINVIGADGSGRKVLPAVGADAVTPDWSDDGKIVYATRVNGSYTLAVFDLDGGKNSRITHEEGVWESPAWAADNRQVICKRGNGRDSALYVVDTWTGKSRLLLKTPYKLSMPSWSRARRR